jgi:dipeptidyl aminopeptidase/acylaminoacyl peptidase
MKKLILYLCLTLFSSFLHARQNKLLLKKERFIINSDNKRLSAIPYKDSIAVFNMVYSSDGLKINGFVVTPVEQGTYPVIIYNRGGNSVMGELTYPAVYSILGSIAKEGYVVVASQYRGSAGSEGTDEFGGRDVNDVVNLLDVLPEIAGADTTNVGMYGWSRGGMMTYLALARTNRLKAIAVGGAPSDLEASITRPEMEKVFELSIPAYKQNKEEELRKRSVLKWVDKLPKNVPVLMMHGNADWRVDVSQTLNLALEFKKYAIPYRLVIFEGSDHGITQHKEEVNTQVIQWFNRFLKDKEKVPDMKPHGN